MANPSSSSGPRTDTAHRASDMGQKATDTAASLAENARETAASVAGKARDAASSLASTAGSVASAVGQRVENAASSVGGGMQSLAGTLRDKAPQGGMMGTAASSMADALDTGGSYLRDHKLSDMGSDILGLIRRNPIPAMLVGIGIGYLFARARRS
jgi:hypothetical protein